jgi:uncharacterized membrane protein YesL
MVLLDVLRDSLNDVRLKGYAYIWSNIAFIVLSLPIVTLPTAWSALIHIAHTAQKDPTEADLALFWETFKANWKQATLWGVPHLIFGVINLTNLITFIQAGGLIGILGRIVFGGVGFVWLGVLFYTWAIYYEMEQPNLWQATRNALVMVLLNPFFTVAILLIIGVLSWISTALVGMWFILTFGIIGALSISSVQHLLKHHYTS